MLRLRQNLARDRALARDGERGTARGDGAVARAHGGRRFAADRGIAETRLTDLRALGGAR